MKEYRSTTDVNSIHIIPIFSSEDRMSLSGQLLQWWRWQTRGRTRQRVGDLDEIHECVEIVRNVGHGHVSNPVGFLLFDLDWLHACGCFVLGGIDWKSELSRFHLEAVLRHTVRIT